MTCAASWTPSSRNATATPTVTPNEASAARAPSMRPLSRSMLFGRGQTGRSPAVMARARAMRPESGAAARPGIGTSAIRPETRARTSRKPHSVARFNVRSVCIASQIAEERGRVGYQAPGNPGKEQQESEQKCRQTRNGVKAWVLDRGEHLQQTDGDPDHESDPEDRKRQPERFEQRVPEDVDRHLRCHEV